MQLPRASAALPVFKSLFRMKVQLTVPNSPFLPSLNESDFATGFKILKYRSLFTFKKNRKLSII
jgi:hypothetical protein